MQKLRVLAALLIASAPLAHADTTPAADARDRALLARMTHDLFPYNYTAPGQTVNLLVSFTSFVESHEPYREAAKELQLELGAEEQAIQALNEFSGPSYRVVSFVVDVPIRVPDALLPPASETHSIRVLESREKSSPRVCTRSTSDA